MKWAEVGYYEGLINRGWVIYITVANGNVHGGARSSRLAMEDDELEAMRAHFPLSFGKTSIVSPPSESIHSATRRADAGASSDSKPSSGFPSLSSSSNSWIQSVRRPKRNPNSTGGAKSSLSPSEDDVSVEDDGVMVGPPPPPPTRDGNDSDDMIGPPPPPRAADVDSDEDDVDDDDDEENRYKIPLSNEIQLKGHTKVLNKSNNCFRNIEN